MPFFVVDVLRKRSKKFFNVGGIRASIYQHLFLCDEVQENDSGQIRKLIEEFLIDFLPNLVYFTHLPFNLFVGVVLLLLLQLGIALSSMRGIIRYHRSNVAKVAHVIVVIIVEVIVVVIVANVAVPIIIFVFRSTNV